MRNDEFQYAIDQIRAERHDFMNYLQVIYGYMQINKTQDAMDYIKEINKKITILSQIFNLEAPSFAIIMQDFISKCYNRNINVDFYTELEYINCDAFSKNMYGIRKIMYSIIDKFVDILFNKYENDNNIYINLAGEPDDIELIISNSEPLIYDNKYINMDLQEKIVDEENMCYVSLYNCNKDMVFVVRYKNR